MNEDTQYAATATAHKVRAGEYVAFTFATSPTPTGKFVFLKVGKGWRVSHVDLAGEPTAQGQHPERRYHKVQPTLKAAKDFAEAVVRNLPNNVARRREEALRRAMPIGHPPIGGV